jgi:hypothetical protein
MEDFEAAELVKHFHGNLGVAKDAMASKAFNDARWFLSRADHGAVNDGQRRLVNALRRTLDRLDPAPKEA